MKGNMKEKNIKDDFLTIDQVAKYLKCCNRTIYNLVSNKRIPGKIFGKKVGNAWKIRMEDIIRFFYGEDNYKK
jgi:excisionase family DNA binding protein